MFTPAGSTNKKEIERIRRLVDARLSSLYGSLSGFKYEVVIAETLCTEPDCVPIETIIGIILMDNGVKSSIEPRRYTTKVLKPLVEVKQMDILGISFPFHVAAPTALPQPPKHDLAPSQPPAPPLVQEDNTEQQACKRLLSDLHEGLSTLQEIESWKRMKDELQKEVNELNIKIKIKLSEEKVTKVNILPSSGKMAILSSSQDQSNPGTATPTNAKTTQQDDVIVVKKNESTGPVISAINAYSKSIARANASTDGGSASSRHDKNRPKSGCPCCDPDNLDHVVDKLLFMERPGI
ncbi:hypothetical protein EON65_13265 [archaeon]|nr:MAG: hypothetical protein EON65_13265 [archaeon]